MALTSTERAQRSRRHAAGDHTLCDPKRRCTSVTNAASGESRGQRLYRELSAGADLTPGQLVLLEEAARITDRLDRLDVQLDGGDWLRLRLSPRSGDVIVIVDKALAEARQQATALKQIIAELRQSGPASLSARGKAAAAGQAGKGASGLGDLTARIAAGRSRPA
jgi:hypothetical protein